MAVYAAAYSVVVRNATIEARFPGGMRGFTASRPNETFCTDGTISRVGFLTQEDAHAFVARLVDAGITPSAGEAAGEIAVAIGGKGFLDPCDWLQLGFMGPHPAAWLSGSAPGELFISQSEAQASTPLQPISKKDLRSSYDYVGIERKVEVYRHKTTGEFMYVGRPFRQVPARKWWQFWK